MRKSYEEGVLLEFVRYVQFYHVSHSICGKKAWNWESRIQKNEIKSHNTIVNICDLRSNRNCQSKENCHHMLWRLHLSRIWRYSMTRTISMKCSIFDWLHVPHLLKGNLFFSPFQITFLKMYFHFPLISRKYLESVKILFLILFQIGFPNGC